MVGMSGRRGEQSRADEIGQRTEEEQEDFYDCQETLGAPDQRTDEPEQWWSQSEDRTTLECSGDVPTNMPMDRRDEERETGGKENEWEEESELKEDFSKVMEFDDDYLSELEKELTEEEKEDRRQQSLSLKEAGNSEFKSGDWCKAEQSYTEALSVCPVCFSKERSVLFSNRAAARLHQELKNEAISDCSRAIDLDPNYLRALVRRAELYEQTEKLDEALEDYKKVVELDPDHVSARQACMRLPQQIQERNEKLKEEMMGKLKDLGNMMLRPFGLSTSNFQVNQDPTSGSYSINFVQNPNNNNR